MAKVCVLLVSLFQSLLVIRHRHVTIVIVLIPLYVTSCESRTRQCVDSTITNDPTIINLNRNRHRQSLLLEIIHDHRHHHHRLHHHNRHTRNISDVDSVYIKRELIRVIGDDRCPILTDMNHSLVPLCPTHNVLEYDENRTPAVMRQVKCSCGSCLGTVMEEHRCAPIYTYEQVLRVVGCDHTKHYVYAKVWEPVSIGCECRALSETEQGRINDYVMPP